MHDYTGRDEVILEQALLLPAVERAAYLDRACAGDAELRRRVEGRLTAKDKTAADLVAAATTIPDEDDDWPTDLPRPAAVGQRVGPYKLLQEIGEGGCGKVFMAEQEQPVRRRVALKIIKLGMDTEEVIARFEAERQALAMMDHPNIARVLDAGATPAGRPYFVMELVRGVPITQFCDDGKLSITARLKLFILVCNAVQHAHQKGIIHRDIKPSNILVTENDGVPVPKVIDFGIAKATGGRLTDKTFFTAFEQFIGTPAYMSPEQAELSNADADTRSDIYSLGVLLYQLLTSDTPLDPEKIKEAGVDEIRRCIREDEPPRPSVRLSTFKPDNLSAVAKVRGADGPKLIAQVRGDLDWIVMRCLEKDRRSRYDTASALAQDLQNFLDNEPVSARPPSALYHLQKLARRHRVIFISAAAITTALVLGLGAAIWSAYQEEQQRVRADQQAEIAMKESALAKSAMAETKTAMAETHAALSRTDYLIAIDLVQNDRLPEAVAHLVRALRATPDNQPAATLLCSILTMRNWLVPVAKTSNVTALTTGRRGAGRGNTPGPGGAVGPGGLGRRGQNTPIRSADNLLELRITSGSAQVLDAVSHLPVAPPILNIASGNFSPDGKRVVTVSVDHSARLWDAATGQALSAPMRLNGNTGSAQFSPDGRQIITQSILTDTITRRREDVAETWNAVENPALLLSIRDTGAIASIDEILNDRLLLTSADNSVRVWDATSGQPVSAPMPHDQRVTAASFSPDGKRVLTVTANNAVRVWDAATGQPITASILDESRAGAGRGQAGPGNRAGLGRGGFGGLVERAGFSPDGRRIFTINRDQSVRVLDVTTDAATAKPLTLGTRISSAEFSPDGRQILTAANVPANPATSGNTAQIWDAATGAKILDFDKETDDLASASYSADGKLALTISVTGEVEVWDAATGQPAGEAINEDTPNLAASFSPDGQRVLTFTRTTDRSARVWEAATGQPVSALMQTAGNLETAAFNADGRWVITLAQGEGNVTKATVGTDGHWTLATAPGVRFWDASKGLAVSVPLSCTEAKLSPDGQRIFTLGDDGVVRVWPFSDNTGPAWILDLAETLAQCQLDNTGSLVYAPGKSMEELQREAKQLTNSTHPMVLWAKRVLGVGDDAK